LFKKIMKKVYVFVLLIMSFLISFSQGQIVNSIFENWTDATHAINWNCDIAYEITYPINYTYHIYTASRTTDAQFGTYAVYMESQKITFDQDYYIPGLIQLGNIALDGNNITLNGGDTCTTRPTGFSFFSKAFPVQGDSAIVAVYMTKYNLTTQTTDTIAATGYVFIDTVDTYKEFNLPFVYFSNETPDTINAIFVSSNPFNVKEGSKLYVDSVSLMYDFFLFETLALEATDVNDSSFSANWIASPLVNDYFIDIAKDEEFVHFVPGYENLSVSEVSSYSIDIPNGYKGPLYYRVRVDYGNDGVSNSSNVIEVKPLYSTVAMEPVNINDYDFTAVWKKIDYAVSYNLDVATDNDFLNKIDGYDSINVVDTFMLVSGLTQNTDYFYRVQTVYEDNTGPYSNTVSLVTTRLKEIYTGYNDYYVRNNILFLENLPLKSEINVFDVSGKNVFSTVNNTQNIQISLETKGIYIVVINGQENTYRIKISI